MLIVGPLSQLAEDAGLDPVRSGFDSLGGHQKFCRSSLMLKQSSPKRLDAGSIPASGANVRVA